jgi:hypothetical protein
MERIIMRWASSKRFDRRHLAHHLLLHHAFAADLLEESSLLGVRVGPQDAERVDLIEEKVGDRGHRNSVCGHLVFVLGCR